MTDLHPVSMPEISATVEYLSGSIQRLSDSRFYAVIPGRRGCLTSYKTTQPDAAFRQAYNYLRRAAELPKMPRLCSSCGQRPTWKQSHKCMACSRPKRNAAELARNATKQPLPDVEASALTMISNASSAQNGTTVAKADDAFASGRKFRDALAKCDALILARGGRVPDGYHFEDFRERFERRQHG
jgi:hypothetical protein